MKTPCLNSQSGVTIMELMVAMSLMTFSVLLALQQTRSVFSQAERLNKVVEVESEQVTFNKVLSAAYLRGIEAVYTHIPSAEFPTAGSYHLARGHGAGFMKADQTRCTDFTPSSAASLKSYYGYICCDKDARVNMRLPSGFERTLSVADGCGGRNGLNIVTINPQGKISHSCQPEYNSIQIMKVGYDTNLGSDVIQVVLSTDVGFANDSRGKGRRYEAIFVLGATGAEQVTYCHQTVQKSSP